MKTLHDIKWYKYEATLAKFPSNDIQIKILYRAIITIYVVVIYSVILLANIPMMASMFLSPLCVVICLIKWPRWKKIYHIFYDNDSSCHCVHNCVLFHIPAQSTSYRICFNTHSTLFIFLASVYFHMPGQIPS
jgi:hypothetical protein